MKLGEVVVTHVYCSFTKLHQNRMKNKRVLLIARFSVRNFKVSVESWKSYIVGPSMRKNFKNVGFSLWGKQMSGFPNLYFVLDFSLLWSAIVSSSPSVSQAVIVGFFCHHKLLFHFSIYVKGVMAAFSHGFWEQIAINVGPHSQSKTQ